MFSIVLIERIGGVSAGAWSVWEKAGSVVAERSLKTMVALLVVLGGLLAAAVPAFAALSTVPDNAPQTNGVVSAVLVSGGRVYIGGSFTAVDGEPRNRLAAIDAATGDLTNWAPDVNNRVLALAASPDGGRIYAGGGFSAVDGAARSRLVALDAATGSVDGRWRPRANSTVRALAASAGGVYVGGDFTLMNGQSRSRLALVDALTGGPSQIWNPAANSTVRALSLDGGSLYAGGAFTSISGEPRNRLAALDPITGAVRGLRAETRGLVYDLDVAGGNVYTAEGGPGGTVASYNAVSGARDWRLSADGDVQAVTFMAGKVYYGGHFLVSGGQARRFFAAANAASGALDQRWNPTGMGSKLTSGLSTGVWALTPDTTGTRLYAGTNFPKVSGLSRRGFVQFSDDGL